MSSKGKGKSMNLIQKKMKMYSHLYPSMLDKRDPNLWVFGSWFGSRFADNPKYLYLYCVKTGINSVWITKNTEIYNDLRRQGLPVALEESKEGIEACKKAKPELTIPVQEPAGKKPGLRQ